MSNVQERRNAYKRVKRIIGQNAQILKAGGNDPDNVIRDYEVFLDRKTKDWTIDDFERLEKLILSEVEIIENGWRQNPEWKKAVSV